MAARERSRADVDGRQPPADLAYRIESFFAELE
jgi:hypothetical protein